MSAGGGGMRRLSDVLGQELSERLQATSQGLGPAPPSQAEMDALFADLENTVGGGSGKADGGGGTGHADAPHAATRMVHETYGYAVLGGVVPRDASSSKNSSAGGEDAGSTLMQAQARVHPTRTFLPGQTYDAAVGAIAPYIVTCLRVCQD